MKNLVVVVDMQDGFVNFGALADKNINRIVPNIVKLVKSSINAGFDVVATKDAHEINDVEFEIYPLHCIRGTDEWRLIPELRQFEDQMIIIEKPTTNAFDTEAFKELIKNNDYDNVIVAGCCTDICVANFIESLNKHFVRENKNTRIIVTSDAVDTFGGDGHNPDTINNEYLNIFEQKYNATVCPLNSLANELKSNQRRI